MLLFCNVYANDLSGEEFPRCSWCPVMITHRADVDWEQVSHHDRMSSFKSLRTPVGLAAPPFVVWTFFFLTQLFLPLPHLLVCHSAIFTHTPAVAIPPPIPYPPQLCKKTRWSWFCWLWRTARLCPGRSWCCLSSRSWRLGSLRRPKPASATWCSCSTGPLASR